MSGAQQVTSVGRTDVERARPTVRFERLVPWALIAPALVIALVFFGLPILNTLRMSFNLHVDQRVYVPGFTLDQYWMLVKNPVFSGSILTTVKLSLICAFSAVTIGYGFALLVWISPPLWRLGFIGLALCPLLISEISIIFGWWMFFPKTGLLSHALLAAGLIEDRFSLMYTEFAALVGLTYLTLPFSFFIILSILDGMDKRLLEASSDLGAGPLTTFREVMLPLTWPGMLVAFAHAFIWAMGTYATPSALGPDTLWTVGFLVQEQMLGRHNWPMASALAIVLVVGVACIMLLMRRLMARGGRFHD